MNEYVNNETFGFGEQPNNEESSFNYGSISGLGESNYENEDLFSNEVEKQNTQTTLNDSPQGIEYDNQVLGVNLEVPIEQQTINTQSQSHPNESVSYNNIFEIPASRVLTPLDQVRMPEESEVSEKINNLLDNEPVEKSTEQEYSNFEPQKNTFDFEQTPFMDSELTIKENKPVYSSFEEPVEIVEESEPVYSSFEEPVKTVEESEPVYSSFEEPVKTVEESEPVYSSFEEPDKTVEESEPVYSSFEEPVKTVEESEPVYSSFEDSVETIEESEPVYSSFEEPVERSNDYIDESISSDISNELVGSVPVVEMGFQTIPESNEVPSVEPLPTDLGVSVDITEPFASDNRINTEFLEEDDAFVENLNDIVEYDVVEPTIIESPQTQIVSEPINQEEFSVQPTITSDMMSDTPIEELKKLTEYKEEKLNTTDFKALFNRVGVNVQEASDIFIKNTEMKEKLDIKFEEIKKLQSEVEQTKKSQVDEINAYKEEVLNKLTEKKEEIENRINKLKEYQKKLENEKEEFEKFRKSEREEIERVQKEVQEAYDSRREELNHIEDVLRKQKDSLDEERSQLSLDRIQYESDKNELANNLLKFNEIVDSFTTGMDKAALEE